MDREDFQPGMRVRTVEPCLVTSILAKRRGQRVVWHGRVSHLSSERVGAVWVDWDYEFLPHKTNRPVRPEMLCREEARAIVV
jgi:hypothetical protein